jgi:hypothetical protein
MRSIFAVAVGMNVKSGSRLSRLSPSLGLRLTRYSLLSRSGVYRTPYFVDSAYSGHNADTSRMERVSSVELMNQVQKRDFDDI